MHDFLQKASRMHTGTKYLQATLRKMMLFSLYSHTSCPTEPPAATEVCVKPEKSCQKWQSFLLFLRITTVSGPVSPCLLWHGFLLPTHVQHANECSPCIRASGEKFPRGWDSVVFCRIKYLPQQQEAAQLGTVSNFKVRCFLFFFLT